LLKTPSVAVETHGIDFVPLAERYGRPSRLFTLWFSVNLTILGVALGTLGVVAGLSFGWVVTALILGNATGTIIMAAHSAQGPQLGVPQMIQSRAQFGVLGAALPLVAVVIMYTLYCAANAVLAQSPLQHIVPVGGNGALVLFGLMSLAAAFLGYEFIHRAAGVMAVISATFFLMAAYRLLTAHPLGAIGISNATLHFSRAAFILTATQAAAWGISYGPYVADYSRYLPPSVSPSATFWYTAFGCFLGSTVVMVFGAALASVDSAHVADPAAAVAALFGVGQPIARVLIVIGVVQGNVMTLYSAYLSTATIFSSLRGMHRISAGGRLLTMCAVTLAATLISMVAQQNFQAYFSDALNIMIYLLMPWSAINLADYYFVRGGRYNIPDLFRLEGEYGRWRWKALAVYAAGIAVQLPFISLSFYNGPLMQWIGSDIAWIPGLLLPGILYAMVEGRVRAVPRDTDQVGA
jgi:NCS1 family nucleobase:cation symporter-1